jgi:site-specific DNA-methyltransferase (adenine-specific)
VPKAIDKAAGAERDDLGPSPTHHGGGTNNVYAQDAWTKENFALKARLTAPATDAARQWQGWGTALKPAFEPIVMARKPLAKGNTVAANVLVHGTGAINVDGCRIEYTATEQPSQAEWNSKGSTGNGSNHAGQFTAGLRDAYARGEIPVPAGRWPANVALDETMAAGLDTQSGITTSPTSTGRGAGGQHGITSPRGAQGKVWAPGDAGGASRFFYCAKAPKSERPIVDGVAHPTVKPLALMRWLVRLVTPPGGTVLDPFAGSGTTIEAATLEGVNVVGIEREAEYLPLIQARIDRNQVDDDIDDPRYGINPPPAADGGLFEVPA